MTKEKQDSPNRENRRLSLVLCILCVFGAVRLFAYFCECTPWIPKVDFNSRYNEVLCLRAGYDPYDVFTGKVSIPGVVPMSNTHADASGKVEALPSFRDFGKRSHPELEVHAYPPWSYAWLLPWTYVSRETAWLFHLALEIVSFAVLFLLPCRYLSGFPSSRILRLAFFAAVLNLGKVFPATFLCGNYSTFVAAGALGLCVFLNRNRQIPAGFCLALMMLKPQQGAIFVIPLLLGRRFLTVAVGAVLCLVGALWASTFCDSSVLDLIRHANAAGPVFFNGTALLPTRLLRDIWPNASPTLTVPLCAVFGLLICTAVSWRVRHCSSWFDRLAPASLCSLFWMVSRTYDYAMLALPIAVLIPILFQARQNVPAWCRRALWCVFPFLFLRNLNRDVGFKAQYLVKVVLSQIGVDLAPLFALRSAAAAWCWAYQPWFLVPAAWLLAEALNPTRKPMPSRHPTVMG